jgi:hypothetical protein
MKRLIATSLLATTLLSSQSNAASSNPFEQLPDAFANAKYWVDVRYRYEMVDQAGFSEDAKASTVRTNLGYETGEIMGGLKFGGEVQDVSYVGDGEDFNNGINGRTQFPSILDPDGTEVNQIYGTLGFFPGTELKIGRQKINLDNEKFIGSISWRQNDQTFDAVTLKNKSLSGVEILYGFIEDVNRVLGSDNPGGHWESENHIVNIGIDTLKKEVGKIVLYSYMLDFENDSPAKSSKTFGGFLKGKKNLGGFDLKYKAEYAMQSDYGDNPNSYDANFYSLSLGTTFRNINFDIGYEVKESESGTSATTFSTPLGTGHKFNGWSDVLLSPARGLEDLNFTVSYDTGNRNDFFEDMKLIARYHDFSAEAAGADYGDEIDLLVRKKFGRSYFAELKYADFSADSGSGLADTEKVWLTVGARFGN